MSSHPRVSRNKRHRKHYNKGRICTCNKSNDNKRDSCININININNGSGDTGSTGATDCFAVNDRCNDQLAVCYGIAGDNRLGRVICNEAYNNCFLNAGCQQGGGGGDGNCAGEYLNCLDLCEENEFNSPECRLRCREQLLECQPL